ncbi:MAG: peptidoglycan-associated lipoprotein Pal [bacterium]|nr:peptidoglycan-associated lipoprotein Pal [bacterium]
MQRRFPLRDNIVLFFALFTIFSGCAVNRKVPPPSAEELKGINTSSNEMNRADDIAPSEDNSGLDNAQPLPPERDTNITEEALSAKELSIEDGVPIEDKKPLNLDDIYFEFDRSDLSISARKRLEEIAGWMESEQSVKLRIEGHADERGTSEYNLALGDRRANAVKKYLTALGIDGGRLKAISYGEEMPADLVQTESGWAKNRRVHFEQK